MPNTYSDDRLGNFAVAENYIHARVTKFLVALNRHYISEPQKIDNLTGAELESKLAHWLVHGDVV